MDSIGNSHIRSLAVLAGGAALLGLASCVDQHPSAPLSSEPQFVTWGVGDLAEPCFATGTAGTIDGSLNEPDWYDACTVSFPASVTAGRTTPVTARFMVGTTYAYFSAVSASPFANPNSVLRIYLSSDHGTRTIGIAGGAVAEWTCVEGQNCGFPIEVPEGASGARLNYGGGTAYEISWPLTELPEGDVLRVRWETVPGGNSSPTLFPAAGHAPLRLRISGDASENDELLPDIIVTTTAAVTVTIRNPDLDPAVNPDAFQCRIAQPVGVAYQARFNDLPVGSRWVATAGNKKTCNHIVWPPLDPGFVPDLNLPGEQGAVYDEGGPGSLPLTWTNWLQAADNATALVAQVNRNWAINFQGNGRTAQCTAFGDGQFVWAIQPGAGLGAPAFANQPPPGLGLTYGKVVAGSCALAGLPENTSVILQTRNSDGGESTGFLCATCTSAALFPQLQLQGSTLIVDTEGDGTFVDLRTMTFGPVKRPSGELSDSFSILATFQGWNPRTEEAQLEFEMVLNPGTATSQSIKVTAFYGVPKKGNSVGWYITGVQPDHQKNRVEIRSGDFDTTTRFGGLEILIRGWSGVTSAQIRVRANLAGGGMDAMPNNGFAAWPGDNGGSFTISF